MPAYVVFQSTTIDEAKLESYAAKAIPIVLAHGGRRLGSGLATALHGSEHFERGSIFEFPDRLSALAWHDSADYRALLGLRQEAMDCTVSLIG